MELRKRLKTYGADNIHLYTSSFASMYSAVTQHRQQAKFKLITAGENERLFGLQHGIGYGVDEMIQASLFAYIKMGATKADLMPQLFTQRIRKFVTMR